MPAGAAGKRVIGNSHDPSFFHTRCVLACKYRRGALLSHCPYSRPEARLVVASRPNPSVTLALADSTRVRQSGFGAAALAEGPQLGKPISPKDFAAWDLNILPDGSNLPPGSGKERSERSLA